MPQFSSFFLQSNCNEKLISSLKSQLSAKNAQHDKLQNQICDLYHHLEDRSINAQNSLCDAAKFQEKMHQLQVKSYLQCFVNNLLSIPPIIFPPAQMRLYKSQHLYFVLYYLVYFLFIGAANNKYYII